MTAAFVAIAVLVVLFVRDGTTAVAILVAAFGLVLVCGNIFLRSGAKTRSAGPVRGPQGATGGNSRDPELGRR